MKKICVYLMLIGGFLPFLSQAQLSHCYIKGVSAQQYYRCGVDINQFNVGGRVFAQPKGKGCVWVSAGAGYHFTSAVNADYGAVHITYDTSDRHCGVDIVAPMRCYRSPQAEHDCTQAQADQAEAVCQAFVTAAQCQGD